ncbi:enoyl-CoA hydratase/isomerase family protein [Persicimonas caeni]|uniref:Enoyl-CoA hydratase/isomerase family protein n=1 Tax=Persicimonas caeni TaxID=2292766 RepID=A0A4Y6PQA8_PERCE|nr:enoyl-CoA hydratase-related protein [Persicimonas caeni]QDG50522.1 enoyl-CoA hydratase/isomerase family protein [Persicimonas caeni]QED31743.1 enoyl-CoA hydratase/isomerase family protein [Persicimonas caeni]
MSDDAVIISRKRDIATLRLNRPAKYNALNQDLLDRLHGAAAELAFDDDVRAVVLTGEGKAFCAGGDLKEINEDEPDQPGRAFWRLAGRFHEAVKELRAMAKPTIAAINGPAAGGGFSLALACDLRVMSDAAFLKIGYIANGLSIDGGGSFSLPRLVGMGRAMEIAFLDEKISAERALEIGLVNRVASADELDNVAHELANRLAEMPTGALGRAKRLFNASFQNTLERQLELEREAIAEAGNSDEGREGMNAFLEKREPQYR